MNPRHNDRLKKPNDPVNMVMADFEAVALFVGLELKEPGLGVINLLHISAHEDFRSEVEGVVMGIAVVAIGKGVNDRTVSQVKFMEEVGHFFVGNDGLVHFGSFS